MRRRYLLLHSLAHSGTPKGILPEQSAAPRDVEVVDYI
jgi:hypothetical protein